MVLILFLDKLLRLVVDIVPLLRLAHPAVPAVVETPQLVLTTKTVVLVLMVKVSLVGSVKVFQVLVKLAVVEVEPQLLELMRLPLALSRVPVVTV
jgi:hypothetical protein